MSSTRRPTPRKGSSTVQFASELYWGMDLPSIVTTERLLDLVTKHLDKLSNERKRDLFREATIKHLVEPDDECTEGRLREIASELDSLASPRRKWYRYCPLCEHLVLESLEPRARRRTCGRHTPGDVKVRRRAIAQLGAINFFKATYETAASELGYHLEPWSEFVGWLDPSENPEAQIYKYKDARTTQRTYEQVMAELFSQLPKILGGPPPTWPAQLEQCGYPSLEEMIESLANDMRQGTRDGSMPSWAKREATEFVGVAAARSLVFRRLLATRRASHGGQRAGAGRPRSIATA